MGGRSRRLAGTTRKALSGPPCSTCLARENPCDGGYPCSLCARLSEECAYPPPQDLTSPWTERDLDDVERYPETLFLTPGAEGFARLAPAYSSTGKVIHLDWEPAVVQREDLRIRQHPLYPPTILAPASAPTELSLGERESLEPSSDKELLEGAKHALPFDTLHPTLLLRSLLDARLTTSAALAPAHVRLGNTLSLSSSRSSSRSSYTTHAVWARPTSSPPHRHELATGEFLPAPLVRTSDSPVGHAFRPFPLFSPNPSVLASYDQPPLSLQLAPLPTSTPSSLLAIRTATSIKILHSSLQAPSISFARKRKPESILASFEYSGRELGRRTLADVVLGGVGGGVLGAGMVADVEGGLWAWGLGSPKASSTLVDLGMLSQGIPYGTDQSPSLVTSLATPSPRASHNAGDAPTPPNPTSIHVVCTTRDIIWLDDRMPGRDLMRWAHGRAGSSNRGHDATLSLMHLGGDVDEESGEAIDRVVLHSRLHPLLSFHTYSTNASRPPQSLLDPHTLPSPSTSPSWTRTGLAIIPAPSDLSRPDAADSSWLVLESGADDEENLEDPDDFSKKRLEMAADAMRRQAEVGRDGDDVGILTLHDLLKVPFEHINKNAADNSCALPTLPRPTTFLRLPGPPLPNDDLPFLAKAVNAATESLTEPAEWSSLLLRDAPLASADLQDSLRPLPAAKWSHMPRQARELAQRYDVSTEPDSALEREALRACDEVVVDSAAASRLFSFLPVDLDPSLSLHTNAPLPPHLDPPPLHFAYFRPRTGNPIPSEPDGDAREEPTKSLEAPGVRLLLAEWTVGANPETYTWTNPYRSDKSKATAVEQLELPSRGKRKRRTFEPPPSSSAREPSQLQVVTAARRIHPIQEEEPPTSDAPGSGGDFAASQPVGVGAGGSPENASLDQACLNTDHHAAADATSRISDQITTETMGSAWRASGPTPVELNELLFEHRTTIAAATGSLVSVVAGFPLDAVKSRLQVKRYSSVLDCVQRTYAQEGVKGFFRGVTLPLISITGVRTASFSIYTGTKEGLKKRKYFDDKSLASVAVLGFLGGASSGVMLSLGTSAFEYTKISMQLDYLIS
ncbi:hypothetical protein RQP46_000785 [Phenoliferia psychrophenolica]